MRRLLFLFALSCLSLNCTSAAETPASFSGFAFLLGTWNATTTGQGSAGSAALGTYQFKSDLGGTVITRTSSADTCKGPADFDCAHHDLLTIYQDTGDATPHALYADGEGHVLHYNINFPDAKTAIFLTSAPGPKFRLVYHLEGNVMTGKFQIEPPGATEFKSYLEWSGTKQ